jgi:hypothetical protein
MRSTWSGSPGTTRRRRSAVRCRRPSRSRRGSARPATPGRPATAVRGGGGGVRPQPVRAGQPRVRLPRARRRRCHRKRGTRRAPRPTRRAGRPVPRTPPATTASTGAGSRPGPRGHAGRPAGRPVPRAHCLSLVAAPRPRRRPCGPDASPRATGRTDPRCCGALAADRPNRGASSPRPPGPPPVSRPPARVAGAPSRDPEIGSQRRGDGRPHRRTEKGAGDEHRGDRRDVCLAPVAPCATSTTPNGDHGTDHARPRPVTAPGRGVRKGSLLYEMR